MVRDEKWWRLWQTCMMYWNLGRHYREKWLISIYERFPSIRIYSTFWLNFQSSPEVQYSINTLAVRPSCICVEFEFARATWCDLSELAQYWCNEAKVWERQEEIGREQTIHTDLLEFISIAGVDDTYFIFFRAYCIPNHNILIMFEYNCVCCCHGYNLL